MKKIKREDFDCFFEYLKDKGLKESTASKRTQRIVFFILDYLFVYDDALSILEVSGDTIRTFLGNWYIRKVLNSRKTEMMRLQSYSAVEGDEFYEWIEEYNYDW